MNRWILIALLILLMLSACTGGSGAETPLVIPEVPQTGGEDSVATENAQATATLPSESAMPSATAAPTEAQQPAAAVDATSTFPASCPPTQEDMLGPFYTPGAPTRAVFGEGYMLEGIVRSSNGCVPIPGAIVEVWMAGPDGEYRDEYRATLSSDTNGYYRFEGPFPPPYSGRPSHIHLRITAPGYRALVTQHYPQNGIPSASFDLVLQPE